MATTSEWTGWLQAATDLENPQVGTSEWTVWLQAATDPETAGGTTSNWTVWHEATVDGSAFTEWWVASGGSWHPAELRTLS